MKKVLTVLIAATFALSACESPTHDERRVDHSDEFTVINVNIEGRSVPCVFWGVGKSIAVSCDWANAK